MPEWVEQRLDDIAHIGAGSRPTSQGGSVPVLGAGGPVGTTVASNFGPGFILGRVGAVGLMQAVATRCWASDNTLTVRPRSEAVDMRFLEHLLRAVDFNRLATQTAQPLITQSAVAALGVVVPEDLSEQRRIAAILDAAYESIESARREIDKLRCLHRALSENLFSQHAGSSRTMTLADVVDERRPVTYGIVQPGPRQLAGHGVPIIRGQDYSNGVARTHDLYWVRPEIAAPYRRATLEPNDLLLSIVGVYVGTVGQVPEALRGANITQTTARLAITSPNDARYFFHQLIGTAFQTEVRRFTKGSAQPGLNLSDVERMRVCVPAPEVQREVAAVLDDSLARQAATHDGAMKLEAVTRGLAEDLMRGQVRVPAT